MKKEPEFFCLQCGKPLKEGLPIATLISGEEFCSRQCVERFYKEESIRHYAEQDGAL